MPASMLLPHFDFAAPTSVAAACQALAEAPGEAALLAGGTDLLVKMKRGLTKPRLVVSLARLPDLAAITAGPDGLTVGPLATMTRLAEATELGGSDAAGAGTLAGPLAALVEGAASVAGPLIRNRATVGGNIVNARPCADTVPPLIALGAHLDLASSDGTRTVDLDGFITGPGSTGRRADEILVAIRLPQPAPNSGSCYLKLTRRAAMEVTIVGCAASVTLDGPGGHVTRARLVYTSVAPVPLRAPLAEQELVGQPPSPERLAAAAAAARRTATPIDDHRAPAAYRSELVEVLTRRALERAVERAQEGSRP